jgi:hypothetical protein
MISINRDIVQVDDYQFKSIRKAEPLLTLPEGYPSLYKESIS